jgi:hypothetical protein
LLEQKLANRAGGRSLADKEFQERQHRIKDDLRKAMGEKEEISGEYNMKLGFDIHFDYVLEIPNQHQSCQVVFGIYKQGIPLIKSM